MHRIEGENIDVSEGKNLFRTTPPYTVMTPEYANSAQEELMYIIEQSGLPILTQNNDTRTQVWEAIRRIALPHDYIVDSQSTFVALFNRRAANQYEILSTYKTVYFKRIDGGYLTANLLSDGDTWGNLFTNGVVHLEFENGTYLNFSNTKGNITVEEDTCLLENVDVRGAAGVTDAITESFQLDADHVTYRNCRCSSRLSNVAMVGFQGSVTASHNTTSKYVNCSVYDLTTSHATKVIQGFVDTENRSNCLVYNLDNTGNSYKVNDPGVLYTTAQQVGVDFNIAGSVQAALTGLTSTDIAYIDDGLDSLRAYHFDGSTWALVGAGLAIAAVSTPTITTLTSTDIAYMDGSNKDLRTYHFDGANWSQVGNDLNIPVYAFGAIAALTSTNIALIDESSRDLKTYHFDGTDWSQVGNDLNIAGIGTPNLAALNSTDVAFIDDALENLRTYRFDGTDWTQVGSDLNIVGILTPRIVSLNSTHIAYLDFTHKDLRVYGFNGSTWSQVGGELNISSLGTAIATGSMNTTDIVFIDGTNDDLRLYRFDYEIAGNKTI